MCVIVIGQRRCAICDLILADNTPLPLDRRSQECELAGQKHEKRVHINYLPFVCACCKESNRVKLLRGKKVEAGKEKGLSAEAEEFVPEHVERERKVVWVNGWWVEE